jgi:hypothetical protein
VIFQKPDPEAPADIISFESAAPQKPPKTLAMVLRKITGTISVQVERDKQNFARPFEAPSYLNTECSINCSLIFSFLRSPVFDIFVSNNVFLRLYKENHGKSMNESQDAWLYQYFNVL